MTDRLIINNGFIGEIKSLIEKSKQNIAVSVNTEMTLLYWQIGQRINIEVLEGSRADYGKQIVVQLSSNLIIEYGQGWGEKHLRHCLRFSEVFPDFQIVSTLWRQLSWSHLKEVIYIEDPLKREFYIEMCKLERWSVRTFRERIQSMLYERTAISRKPEEKLPPKEILLDKLHKAIEIARTKQNDN